MARLQSHPLLRTLTQNQNLDGGWGYFPNRQSALEPTVYAALSLGSESSAEAPFCKAIRYLETQQLPPGGWPVSSNDEDPAVWITPLVGWALLTLEGGNPSSQQAAGFVTRSFGKFPLSWFMRQLHRLGWLNINNMDLNLGGWSWTSATAPWVEPTCYGLFFLKRLQRERPSEQVGAIIEEAEAMLYDRMCRGGGWNYGNTQVLGEALLPYPLTTALALLALQDRADCEANQQSLAFLKRALTSEQSALTLGTACLCLDAYHQEWQHLLDPLAELYQQTDFFGGIMATASALMAIHAIEGINPLRQETLATPHGS